MHVHCMHAQESRRLHSDKYTRVAAVVVVNLDASKYVLLAATLCYLSVLHHSQRVFYAFMEFFAVIP